MRRRATVTVLGLLFTVSLALRLWFGLGLVHERQMWDEQFTARNVAKVLRDQTLKPENGYYSMISYLPQTAVLAVVQRLHTADPERGFEVLRRGRSNNAWDLSLDAFRVLRGWQAVIGALVCVPAFFLGRRLSGEMSGWVAAALVAFAPQHIRPAAWAKPDALWTLACAMTLVFAVRAVAKPDLKRFILVGVSLGVAASAKVPAVFLAPSVGLAIVLIDASWRRRWSWLSATAVGSAVTFVLLNPYLGMTVDYLGRLSRQYANRADARGEDRWLGLRKAVIDFPVEAIGALGALAVAVGFVWLLVVAWKERGVRSEFPARVLLLSVPLFYLVLYFALTPLYKANSLLPLIPLLPLFAVFPVEWWWRTRSKVSLSRRRALLTVVASVGIALAAARGFKYVYQSMVPTSVLAANRWLALRLEHSRRPLPRLLVFGEFSDPGYPFKGHKGRPAPLGAVRQLDEVFVGDATSLELADAVVIPTQTELVSILAARTDTEPFRTSKSVDPRLFKLRGDPLTIFYYHWKAVASVPLEVGGEEFVDSIEWPVPQIAAGDLISVALNLSGCGRSEVPQLTIGSRLVQLHRTSRRTRGETIMISARFEGDEGDRIELALDEPCRVRHANLLTWRREHRNGSVTTAVD